MFLRVPVRNVQAIVPTVPQVLAVSNAALAMFYVQMAPAQNLTIGMGLLKLKVQIPQTQPHKMLSVLRDALNALTIWARSIAQLPRMDTLLIQPEM